MTGPRSPYTHMGTETGRRELKQVGVNPSSNPDFGKTIDTPVWYLSHPLAEDKKYTFQKNMDHTLHMLELCLQEGFRAIVPYHSICLLGEETAESRRVGLEIDCFVARRLGRIILSGHKISSGMLNEYKYASLHPEFQFIDISGWPDDKAREILRICKEYLQDTTRPLPAFMDKDRIFPHGVL